MISPFECHRCSHPLVFAGLCQDCARITLEERAEEADELRQQRKDDAAEYEQDDKDRDAWEQGRPDDDNHPDYEDQRKSDKELN